MFACFYATVCNHGVVFPEAVPGGGRRHAVTVRWGDPQPTPGPAPSAPRGLTAPPRVAAPRHVTQQARNAADHVAKRAGVSQHHVTVPVGHGANHGAPVKRSIRSGTCSWKHGLGRYMQQQPLHCLSARRCSCRCCEALCPLRRRHTAFLLAVYQSSLSRETTAAWSSDAALPTAPPVADARRQDSVTSPGVIDAPLIDSAARPIGPSGSIIVRNQGAKVAGRYGVHPLSCLACSYVTWRRPAGYKTHGDPASRPFAADSATRHRHISDSTASQHRQLSRRPELPREVHCCSVAGVNWFIQIFDLLRT